MKRTRLRNKFSKIKSEYDNNATSNKKIIVCVYLEERKRSAMET